MHKKVMYNSRMQHKCRHR